MKHKATHIACLINRSALGEEGRKYQRLLEKYIDTNGVEWTVSRLKAVYNAALHMKNGDIEKAKLVYQSQSIAYTKAGYPKDPVLAVPSKRFVASKKPSKIKRYAAVLRSYTCFTLSDVSLQQSMKVVSTITEPPTWGDGEKITNTAKMLLDMGFKAYGIDFKEPLRFRGEDFCLSNLAPFTACYAARKVPKSLHRIDITDDNGKTMSEKDLKKAFPNQKFHKPATRPWFKAVFSLMNSYYLPAALERAVPCWEIRQKQEELYSSDPLGRSDAFGAPGKVHIIQEGGAKARAVAIPNAWVQMGFYPLHRHLSEITAKYLSSNSCVTNQKKGALAVLDRLERGLPCYSVDLSAATDRFPLVYQTEVLRKIPGLESYATALEELCSKEWMFPQGAKYGIKSVRYATGQPMGLYGSFPLFNLTHIILVKGIEQWLLKKYPQQDLDTFNDGTTFKVVGDDIVISDKRLKQYYTQFLTESGVSVSPLKTFEGGVAEFAGFVMMKADTPRGVMAFRPYKFPDEKFISNPINLLDALGVKVKKMGKRWHAILDAYNRTSSYRNLELSPIFSMNQELLGLAGTLDIQTVVSLRNTILVAERPWYELYLGKEDWPCERPIIYDGFRSKPDGKVLVTKHRILQEYEDAPKLTKGVQPAKKVVVPPVDSPEQLPATKHYVQTARRVNSDPLIQEGLREAREYESTSQTSLETNAKSDNCANKEVLTGKPTIRSPRPR